MVMAIDQQKLLTHYWLRSGTDRVFHAYFDAPPTSASACGRASPLSSVRDMDIPGVRSKVCIHCCTALFGNVGYFPPGELE